MAQRRRYSPASCIIVTRAALRGVYVLAKQSQCASHQHSLSRRLASYMPSCGTPKSRYQTGLAQLGRHSIKRARAAAAASTWRRAGEHLRIFLRRRCRKWPAINARLVTVRVATQTIRALLVSLACTERTSAGSKSLCRVGISINIKASPSTAVPNQLRLGLALGLFNIVRRRRGEIAA